MALLLLVTAGVFLLEGKSVYLARDRRTRAVYYCIWLAGIALLMVGVLDAKDAVLDAAMECVRRVKLWSAGI